MDVRVAQVGHGYWGRNLARNLAEMGVLDLVCDEDPSATTEIAAAGVRTTQRFEDVLADPTVDAVVVSTPAVTHADLGRRVIEAGKDLFVEKPLALDLARGRELVAAADSAGAVLMVGHILEYHPAVDALKTMVAEGELGELRYLYSNRLNLGKVRVEENILWSFAPHDLSVIMGLVGSEPVSVATWGGAYLRDEIADVTVTGMVFPGGVRGHVFVSWLHPFKEQRLVVVGDRRMAVFADTDADKLVLYDKGVDMDGEMPVLRGEAGRVIELPTEEPLRRELEHFVDCVARRLRPLTDGGNGLAVLRVLEAAQASLENGGKPVSLAEGEG